MISPLSPYIMALRLPKVSKMPHVTPYSGQINPKFHVEQYRDIMHIQGLTKDEMCKPFSLTLGGQAKAWY